MVGILLSFWDGQFSGAMLVSGSVCFHLNLRRCLAEFESTTSVLLLVSGGCIKFQKRTDQSLTPLKFNREFPLENDGWKTDYSPVGIAHFQGRAVKHPGVEINKISL